ncbi:PDZ domain-containing protein GIPC1-like [Lytechinus pictus]|uniref:PDZ domain-containing protein GIPC1-like n=1 Tax=Lytechinus pictus TaxID=7653 RepID=UPI00240E89DF|nr:PDZ domain-containing protein GIPC1-like [Lytechinus pictus]
MPFFSKKKGDKKKNGGFADPVSNPQNYNGAGDDTPTHSPYADDPSSRALPTLPADAAAGQQSSPSRQPTTNPAPHAPPPKPQRLVFSAFLAHGSPPTKVEGFTNVTELYGKIGEGFSMPASEILFCTLNTFKIDMEKLLGGQIGLSDSIYAHIKGQKFEIAVNKIEAALGLTITDNGAGYAFVKRIKEGSTMEKNGYVEVGDHIVKINSTEMIGCRHYEVARALKDLPVGEEFTMKLIRPHKAFNEIGPRGSKVSSMATNNNIGTGKATLRLHSKGPATVEKLPGEYEQLAVGKVDDCLESYMGIRDMDLAASIVDMFKGKTDFVEFMTAFNENFDLFGFPEAFVFEVWGFIKDAKDKRLKDPSSNLVEFDEAF